MSIGRVIIRRWWLIALPTLIALVFTIPSLKAIISPPISYTVTMRYSASAKPNGTGSFQDQAYTPWLQSEYVVTNLASWVQTDSFDGLVSVVVNAQLTAQDQPINAVQLRGTITAESARSILQLHVNWPNADQLKLLAAACSQVLAQNTSDYWPQTAALKLDVLALDQVNVVSAVPPLTARLSPLARIGIGFGLGIVLAFFAEYLDRSLRTRAEVEGLGLAVIAEIPRG
jgi:capsular polysaccharide biosynthesis protein